MKPCVVVYFFINGMTTGAIFILFFGSKITTSQFVASSITIAFLVSFGLIYLHKENIDSLAFSITIIDKLNGLILDDSDFEYILYGTTEKMNKNDENNKSA